MSEATSSGALSRALEAGEWTPFKVRLPDVEWDSWRLTVKAGMFSWPDHTGSGLVIEPNELLPDGTLRSVIRNTAAAPIADPWGVAAAYDGDGNVVAVGWNHAEASVLQPGEATIHEITGRSDWMGDIGQAQDYGILVMGKTD